MKIKHQEYNNITVVELQGEFVEEFCKTFQGQMAELIRADMAGIVLDMSKTPFIDSKGLEQLLWLRDYCHDNKSQLKLAGLDDNIAKILELTRMDSKLDCYEELAGAVKSFT
ncbi:MAG: STAS domain-containing protein [Phycisphaerae bacterium]|nr:STAS domain-containing protein [Phycisphaerae bacterium]